MSFFNDSSACHASSNPLSKIVDTTTNEQHNLNGVSNFQNGRSSHVQNNLHHFQNIDSSVQNEFNTFSSPGQNPQMNNDYSFQKMDMKDFSRSPLHQIHRQPQSQQGNWVSDFRSFTLSDASTQILQQNEQEYHQHQQPNNYAHPIPTVNHHPNHLQTPAISASSYRPLESTHQSSTSLKELNNEFDNAFIEVENEMNLVSSTQNQASIEEEENGKVVNDEEDKVKFAILAQNVFNMMNNTPKHVSSNTSNKFKQSGFMQLMNKISNREIEISRDQQKLVDQDGKDIRSDLADPLSHISLSDTLESPFDAAVKVSQNTAVNVDLNSWQGDFV